MNINGGWLRINLTLLYCSGSSHCSIIIANLSNQSCNLTDEVVKMISMEEEKLLAVLKHNARASISDLARMLDLSRSTVQTRIAKLEQSGVIKGYSVDYGEDYLASLVSAHVSIKVRQKLTAKTNVELKQIAQVSALYAISGEYDLIAIVQAQSTEQLSHILDDIGNLDGVERTNSSVILETKFKR
ncbi:Lrp/AsnC family transcriptional regulator [Rheinheimera sp. NSM]|uniref:Lrp/AsnC family transcriptional regulator n=1 Tax=Rheinheimera sp. NSM TaxID=3457884 RepID=UPI004035A2B8